MKKKAAKAAPKKTMMKRTSAKKAPQQMQQQAPPVPAQQAPQPPMGTPAPGTNGPMMRKGGTIKKKAQSGLGMKSVKAGYDKNPGVTRADFVSMAKGEAKNGKSMKKAQTGEKLYPTYGVGGKDMPAKSGKSMKKCKYGCK